MKDKTEYEKEVIIDLIHGDCLENMKDIPDGSIDMVLTSPPYDNLRTYNGSLDWGEHIWKPIIQELFRIIKDGGLGSLVDDTFTYWTGFASTKGEGCEDISPNQEDGYLLYNAPDLLLDPSNSAMLDVEISEYTYIGFNDIEYLQSIIYLPYNFEQIDSATLTIDGNLLLTTTNSTCTTVPCKLELKANNTIYKVTSLQEVFDNIVSGKVCVSENRLGNKTNWKLFWNENEILKTLNAKKELITDAELCQARVIQEN